MASLVLSGQSLTRADAAAVLQCPDVELPALLAATYRVRYEHWQNEVQLYYLRNAKSGLCAEDCGYCSQSKVSDAEIPKYRWNDAETLLASARVAAESKARTFCIVASGRGPSDRELDHVVDVVQKIKQSLDLNICCCLGLLRPDQAERLAAAGVDRVNHNLNTSQRYYAEICSTHTYEDRLETLRAVRSAGMELCSGGIVGMGETEHDVIDLVFSLRELQVESIPVNFLHPIDGTPLQAVRELNPRQCLKTLCLFRLVNPAAEIRIAGGRELHLRTLQPLGLYAANSMFVSDYLTTKGQSADDDYNMIADLGFVITNPGPETAAGRAAAAVAAKSGETTAGSVTSATTAASSCGDHAQHEHVQHEHPHAERPHDGHAANHTPSGGCSSGGSAVGGCGGGGCGSAQTSGAQIRL